jgi:SAM-dependent methyltransferase
MGILMSAPRLARGYWPKNLPPLTPEQRRISDDFMKHWHEVLPRRYGLVERFNHIYPVKAAPVMAGWRTLEIGAGLGEHLKYEDLDKQEYHCVEIRSNMADAIMERFPGVSAIVADCQQRLPYEDGYFNRAIAVHVLEHLPDLPAAVDEIHRVLKRDGAFVLVIPCDPGFAYEVARKISAERIFRKRYRQSYKWLIRREHINSPAEIENVLASKFRVVDREFYPMRVPLVHLNLCVGMVARKR